MFERTLTYFGDAVMARTITKTEALPQLATLPERVGVLEAKVEIIDDKLGDLKVDLKEVHDCLDRTRDLLDEKLDKMMDEYHKGREAYYAYTDKLHEEDQNAHLKLAEKINDLEKQKHKFVLYAMMTMAFAAGAGWIGHLDLARIVKFVGL